MRDDLWTKIDKIGPILKKHGLKKTWVRLLRNRIAARGEDFSYILRSSSLKESATFEDDLIEGLTVGELSVLYEYSLAYANRNQRKELGQYFTPDDVATFMASKAGQLDPHGDHVWMDPCSGVGNLAFRIVEQQARPEEFLQKNLYLVDVDPLALLIARTIFVLAFQKSEKHLFTKIEHRFIETDFLSADKLPNFDFAILNPPYVVVEPRPDFATADARDLYAYFLERVTKLAALGFVSVTPQSFTNGRKFASLRELFLQEPREISIYCFDNVPDSLFKGYKFGSTNTNTANSTRAAITVIKKAKKSLHRITPLVRWRAKERAHLFANIDSLLSEPVLSKSVFPKVGRGLLQLYGDASKFKPLRNFVSTRPTAHRLFVPSTPRYFISALKKSVSRTSCKVLYFDSNEALERAYLLLNSSYMYWWWRVNDGGMTVSEKTLLSMPMKDDFEVDAEIVRQLEQSEKTNKVYKLNAGKLIENVKHDEELVEKITHLLFPAHSRQLAMVHQNSSLSSLLEKHHATPC